MRYVANAGRTYHDEATNSIRRTSLPKHSTGMRTHTLESVYKPVLLLIS